MMALRETRLILYRPFLALWLTTSTLTPAVSQIQLLPLKVGVIGLNVARSERMPFKQMGEMSRFALNSLNSETLRLSRQLEMAVGKAAMLRLILTWDC